MPHRNPYVGEGADGARRSAEIDRSEAEGLDRVADAERIRERLESAARWEQQADELDAAATPVGRLLSDPSRCRRFTDNVAVHWFPSFAAGAPCQCGESSYRSEFS